MKPILVPLQLIIENTYKYICFIMVTLMIHVFVFITTKINPILIPYHSIPRYIIKHFSTINITIENCVNIYNSNVNK